MKRLLMACGLAGLLAGGTAGFEIGLRQHQPRLDAPRMVALCDARGNLVYMTSSGGIYVLEGCP